MACLVKRLVAGNRSQCRTINPLLACYWRRCSNSKAPVLDINDYKVSVIDTAEQCETYFKEKRLQDTTFIGFDCEWVSQTWNNWNKKKPYPVALLQLAFPNKECALVRLSKIGRLTESLLKILTDKRYVQIKCGAIQAPLICLYVYVNFIYSIYLN